MEDVIADKLSSEALQPLKIDSNGTLTGDCRKGVPYNGDASALWDGDGSEWHQARDGYDISSDLNREWQKRHDEFYSIGYRDGLTAGKQDSAQEGFNLGFGQSVLVGHNWGLVRGVTSTLACLPDACKEKLMETALQRLKLHRLYESVRALSTADGLKLFHDHIMTQNSENENQNPGSNLLAECFGELRSLLSELPGVGIDLPAELS